MKKILIYITLFMWLLYFLTISKNTLKDLKSNKVTKEWIKKNIFKIFHFDTLCLIGTFTFFNCFFHSSSQLWLVRILLFGVFNLYLYLNSFYDKNHIKESITTNDISSLLIILLVTGLPIVFYMATKRYVITYFIMFGYTFFNYLVVYICLLIDKFLFDIVLKHNNENK